MVFRFTKTLPLVVITLFLSVSILEAIALDDDGSYTDRGLAPPVRGLVTISKEHLRIISGGISQWGPHCFGIVNRTTVIEMRLRNTADAPFTGIEVNLTLYWYDAHKGFSFDKGRVMFRDRTLSSIGPGDGTLSNTIEFKWVPRFAGAYVMNITIRLSGDPRPYTERTLVAGLQYKLDEKTITDGLWVGTDSWNGSSMEGWTSMTDQSEADMQWHISNHSLAQGYETLHTPDSAFWVGNDTTGLSPQTGVYSLISPILNLSRFNPDPWDSFLSTSRPQIYLLYKYRGNITKVGPAGNAGVYHWIRYRTNGLWGAWEPLLDPKGYWVNLTGNTSNVIWDISKRPFLQGDLELVGLDLGEYQGRTVQVKFEYHPSGHPETGYVIDDILLIGKETVDTDPFFISSYTREVIPSDPGESVRFNIELVSKLKVTDNDVSVRAEAVDGSDFIDLYRNVDVQPGIIELPKASTIPMLFSINLTLPSSSPSGEGWLKIRVFGSGTFKDVTFRFFVNSRRALELSVDGMVSGMLEPGIPGSLEVTVRNMGNVEELVFLSFLSDTDLVAEGNMDPFSLLPGKSRTSYYNISVPEGSFAGYKNGFILISRSATPSDALDRLLIDDPMSGWSYVELEYFVEYIYDLELIEPSPAATYWEIKDPAQNGTKDVDYHLILENRGNSRDEALFSSPGWTDREDVMLILPENVSIPPGSTMFVNISVRVSYPVPNGIYNFNIQATSLGNEEIKTDIISLTLSVGEAPVSSGIYLVNGSLDLQPSRMVVGQEVVLSFTVRSFGFLDGDTFNVKLWLNNKEVYTKSFPISKYQDKVCQLTWTFDQSGMVNLMISLPDSKKPAHGTSDLVLSLEKEIIVGYIELGITSVNLLVEDGEEVDEGAQPGMYEVLVRVVNNGNTTADIFVVSLIIEEKEQQNGWNLSTNVTDLSPGETRNITFKNIRLQQETSYRFSVLIDNNGRWRETDIDNDLKNLEVEVGAIPPDLPIWRNPVWGIIGFVMTLLITLGLLFYMLRKKL